MDLAIQERTRILSKLRCLFSFFSLDPQIAQTTEITAFSRKARHSMHLSDLLENAALIRQ